jgi:endonuclease YncB( thermonuclease family)
MNPRLKFRRLKWKWSLPGLVLVALLAAFFNPPDPGVTSGEFEFVQRVVDGDTLVLGKGERVRLIGVNTPETVHPKRLSRHSARKPRRSPSAWWKVN